MLQKEMPDVLSVEINIPQDSPCEVMGCQIPLAKHFNLCFVYKSEATWSSFLIYQLVFHLSPLCRFMPVAHSQVSLFKQGITGPLQKEGMAPEK